MLNSNLAAIGIFGSFINSYGLAFIKFFRSLGFSDFWINALLLWLPVKLSILELKFKYGSLENYLYHCDQQRRFDHENS